MAKAGFIGKCEGGNIHDFARPKMTNQTFNMDVRHKNVVEGRSCPSIGLFVGLLVHRVGLSVGPSVCADRVKKCENAHLGGCSYDCLDV